MVAVSPHLDDAVLGCGHAIAARPGSVVITVFAGTPNEAHRLTEWDARCGFASAEEAIAARRREDRAALAQLQATPLWLDFCDSQYGETPAREHIAQALRRQLVELAPDLVLFPLGLFHSDHLLVHEASAEALRAGAGVPALAYEDALYRGLRGQLQQRLAALAAAGVRATPARWPADDLAGAKARAVQCYASQLRAFGPDGYADAGQPERYWHLDEADRA